MLDGALASRGMASFSRFLNEKEVEDLRAYILTESKKSQTRTATSANLAPRG
jgi:hypothetical protein